MDQLQYEAMMHAEDHHWWFKGRRAVINRYLQRLPLPAQAHVLEIGCGSGGNLPMLARVAGDLKAVEPTDALRERARSRGLCPVETGLLPDGLPYGDEKFDLICLFDVLEHVEPHAESIRALANRLNDGGWLLLTVPASPALWSYHDVQNHHFRRYTKQSLREVLEINGMNVRRISYFNTTLFPAVYAARRFRGSHDKQGPQKADIDVGIPGVSSVLGGIMQMEAQMLPYLPFPFGVSLVCAARKANASAS